MRILLVKRDNYPYKDKWCLPGGFLNPKIETLEECTKRVLKIETNLENIYLEQLYTFDSLNRDSRMRVLSTAFISLVDKNKLTNIINKNAKWFDIKEIIEKQNTIKISLINEKKLTLLFEKVLVEKTFNRYNFLSINNSKIAFDHDLVIINGLYRIRNKLSYTDIVFNLMPKYFTLKDLQQVYELILGKKLLDPAFRRIIKNKVKKANKKEQDIGHRPSSLYCYKDNF